MKTAKERVKKGVAWLDRQNNLKGWRNRVNPDTMQFANPDKGPLGQLFGDYLSGLKALRIIGGGSDFGFRSGGDPAELKQVWQCELITDEKWDHCNEWYAYKSIKGIRYDLCKEKDGKISIFEKDVLVKTGYSSYDSAKRAVRKLSKKI